MTWGAVAGAAVSVVGGMMAKDSADDGLAAQEAGAARSDATQRYMYDTTRADNAPTMQRGNAAGSKLSYLMGLGGSSGGGAPAMTAEQYRAQFLPQFTQTKNSPLSIVDTVASGDTYYNVYSDGSTSSLGDPWTTRMGSQQVVDEAGLSAAIQQAMAQQQTQQQTQQPAASSDPAYGSLLRSFSEQAPEFQKFGEQAPELRKFGASDLAGDLVYQNGLQFGLDEGRKGIERQQQATGGLLSGATLKALSRFGNDYATTKTTGAYGRFDSEQQQGYGRYVDKYNRFNSDQDRGYNRYVDKYNRFNTDRDSTFNKLSAIAGTGQTATNQVGVAGQNYANRVSNTAEGMGNATAAAGIAGSNAISGGLRGAYDNYQTNELIKNLRGSSGTGYNGNTGYARGADPLGDMINANGWSRS